MTGQLRWTAAHSPNDKLARGASGKDKALAARDGFTGP